MRCLWFQLLILSTIFSFAEFLILDCIFEFNAFKDYTCFATESFEINSEDDRTITEVEGNHAEGKTNGDVKAFGARDITIKYFPKDLQKFFPQVAIIDIENSELQEITREDVAPFGSKLTTLFLAENEIENIEADTFTENTNLVSVSLNRNHIKYVGTGVFSKLSNLAVLQFEDNICFSLILHDEPEHVNIVAHEIEAGCTKDNQNNIVRDIQESLTDVKDVIDGLMHRLNI